MSLVYYPDDRPGISRRRHGRGFSYRAPDGTRIDDRRERARLDAMAVPPAYVDVWMTPRANGHLWATGRDDAGRKQYRYHPDWSARQSEKKFDRLAEVGAALPTLRRWIADRLAGDAGQRDTVIAAALALIDRAALRPGDPVYTRENGSVGATTLKARHLTVEDGRITLRYPAKGGQRVEKTLHGTRLAEVLHASADLPGPDLMVYEDDAGTVRQVRTEHLSEVLESVCGAGVTPKALRTWAGTRAAFLAAREAGDALTIKAMTDAASTTLHNTPAIARKSYIHPDVIALAEMTPEARKARLDALPDSTTPPLRAGEEALMAFLRG